MKNAMKKTIVTVLAALTICSAAFAKKDAPNITFSAGWAATVKNDKLIATGDMTKELLNGWFIKGDYTFRELLGPVNITPGVRFQQTFSKKDEFDIPGLGKYTEQDIIADIQVPVDFSWSLDLGNIEPFIFAGPTFNFGLTSRTVKRFNDGYKEEPMHYRRDTDYRPFNIMIGGGVGCRFKCIRITARFDYGLINRWRGETAKIQRMSDSQITVGVGYCF